MSEEVLLETPLAAEHAALGAKMVPFAGWNMPVQYAAGILAEHKHTREAVSLFDICHMGEFRVKGPGSAEALDGALARAVTDQKTGVCRYNFLLNEKGGVLDDLIVYRISGDEFFIVVNAARRENDFAELSKRLPEACGITDESAATAKLDLQGPLAADVLVRLGVAADALPAYYHFTTVRIAGVDLLLSRTGYTGELGYELYFPAEKAVFLWRTLLACEEVKPAGLGARDTLRLEMGYPLYGHEMNEETTPVEAGFGAMLKLDGQPRRFTGSDALRNAAPKRTKRSPSFKRSSPRQAALQTSRLRRSKAQSTFYPAPFLQELSTSSMNARASKRRRPPSKQAILKRLQSSSTPRTTRFPSSMK